MTPAKIEFAVGETHYHQPLRLIWGCDSNNRWGWSLHRDAANQRDDYVQIGGMSDEVILKMAEAVKARRGLAA